MKYYLKYSLTFSLALALCTGCDNKDLYTDSIQEEVSVKVNVKMPATSTTKTYAMGDIDENDLETVDVLVFNKDAGNQSGWAYSYSAQGTSISSTNGTSTGSDKQFTVKLFKSETEQMFVFLGNVRSQLQALGQIGAGADKDKLLKRLIFENTGCWSARLDENNTFTPFPFWGEIAATITNATSLFDGLKLLRGIARIDVLLDTAVNNFKLNEVYVYNSNTKGQVVPAPGNIDGNTVKAPTIPAGTTQNPSPLQYTVPNTMQRKFVRSIYLFESKGLPGNYSSYATCLVVGGTYSSDTEPTYYRLDFFKKDAHGKNTADYRDILRNQHYQAKIKSVSARGHATPEDAFNSQSIDMDCEIVNWDDNTTETEIGGQYYLKVDKNPVNMYGDSSTDNMLMIQTDYPGGWTASVPNVADNWISIEAAHEGKLYFAVSSNIGAPSVRRGYIQIKAGNLTKRITVVQSNTPEVSIEIIQGSTPINSLFFPSLNPASQTYQVYWKPVNASCVVSVVNTKKQGLDLGTSLKTPTISGEVLTLSAASISDATVNSDPFIEKETVVTYTVVDNITGTSKSQSLVLSQINYTLVATEYPTSADATGAYAMNGKTKTFSIQSNLPWRVQETTSTLPEVVHNFTESSGEADIIKHDFTFTIIDGSTYTTIKEKIGELRFSANSGDSNKKFRTNGSYNDVQVNFRAVNGYPYTYSSNTYMAAFTDAGNMNWDQAQSTCTALGTGWRLPSEAEFRGGSGSVFNSLTGNYWTSTYYDWVLFIGDRYRYVIFPGRASNAAGHSTNNRVRCVYGPTK